jgi:hypothetical protein
MALNPQVPIKSRAEQAAHRPVRDAFIETSQKI